MTPEEMKAKIAQLEAEIADQKTAQAAGLTFKVSPKGAVSVYGLGRWPVTLYQPKMVLLLDAEARIRAFMTANDKLLSKSKPIAAPEVKA